MSLINIFPWKLFAYSCFILPRSSYINSSRPTRVVIRYMRGTSSDPWPPIHFISPRHSLVFRYKTSCDVAHHWGVPFKIYGPQKRDTKTFAIEPVLRRRTGQSARKAFLSCVVETECIFRLLEVGISHIPYITLVLAYGILKKNDTFYSAFSAGYERNCLYFKLRFLP